MTIEPRKITIGTAIPAPVDQVWSFLMNEEKMKNWFKAEAFVIDVYEGGKIEIPFSFNGDEFSVVGEIGLILPKEKFVFTWMERDQYGETWFNNTTVTIELEEHEDGTRCTFVHDGFKYLPDDIQVEIYKKYLAFWEHYGILERLQSLVLEK